MSRTLWDQVDAYLVETFVPPDPSFAEALAASAAAGLPAIQVSPPQGRLLEMLARLIRARNILEIGTLGGYSTLWLARGLEPGGRIVTLELEPKHAEVARASFIRAGRAGVIELHVGGRSRPCPGSSASGPARSISASSTRTRRTSPSTSTGPFASRARARSSSSTT